MLKLWCLLVFTSITNAVVVPLFTPLNDTNTTDKCPSCAFYGSYGVGFLPDTEFNLTVVFRVVDECNFTLNLPSSSSSLAILPTSSAISNCGILTLLEQMIAEKGKLLVIPQKEERGNTRFSFFRGSPLDPSYPWVWVPFESSLLLYDMAEKSTQVMVEGTVFDIEQAFLTDFGLCALYVGFLLAIMTSLWLWYVCLERRKKQEMGSDSAREIIYSQVFFSIFFFKSQTGKTDKGSKILLIRTIQKVIQISSR
eukprot:Lithocolla_globosa_v1_NODE_84_length_6699_cov_54.834938.p3 type:complete len:253 gc:universal NODE_84_length_6699_cov_54.834938:2562-3320(+)